jgi:predicted enzyme related to lactoylglutathione lyase
MSTGVTTATGKFVWHEQVSDDPKQAQDFYTQLFGWELEQFKPGEVDYAMIASGGTTHGGFGKRMEQAPPPHWLGHVQVESVDRTIEKAKAAGGTVAFGPMDMPDVGRFAIVGDPQGAYVSAYQPAGDGPAAAGVFVWDELVTSDVEGAKRFYGEVFGWTPEEMGEEYGGYVIFKSGDAQVAGVMQRRDSSTQPLWIPYVGTSDVDATLEKAKGLGASLHIEPMDIPAVGRIAVLGDPQGAAFGLFRPSS